MSSSNDRAVLNCILNPLMPTDVAAVEAKIEEDAPITHSGISASREIEKEGVSLAEEGKVEESIEAFTRAIDACPVNPSALNNRAQALRLAGRVDDALADLTSCIALSEGKGRSACNAFVQRAMIYRLRGDDETARADYTSAASLGSSFAKMQLVALNPYAAMCNAMLAEVMNNCKQGNM